MFPRKTPSTLDFTLLLFLGGGVLTIVRGDLHYCKLLYMYICFRPY